MDIKTAPRRRDSSEASESVPPDRGAYLRRKSSQKLRKRQLASRKIMGILKPAGRIALAVAAIAAVVAGYWNVSSSARFELRMVTCEGCVYVEPAHIEEIIRRECPRNILQIDLARLCERLEKERWIRKVEIRRVLPGSLIIYVEERRPAVIAELNGELILTDPEGMLLDRYADRYGRMDVPVFSGLLGDNLGDYRHYQEENASRIALGLSVLAELSSGAPDVARQISEIDLSDTGNVRVMMVDDTAEIFLGDRDFLKRFQVFMANMPQYQELKAEYSEIASVDLRYDGKIIYRPRNLPETPGEALRAKQP
jgi:cell division septal protein FtsQ